MPELQWVSCREKAAHTLYLHDNDGAWSKSSPTGLGSSDSLQMLWVQISNYRRSLNNMQLNLLSKESTWWLAAVECSQLRGSLFKVFCCHKMTFTSLSVLRSFSKRNYVLGIFSIVYYRCIPSEDARLLMHCITHQGGLRTIQFSKHLHLSNIFVCLFFF